jgi:hypothetical protein
MVKGSNHIFFDVSWLKFYHYSWVAADTTAPTAPTLVASGTTARPLPVILVCSATDAIGVTGYDVFKVRLYSSTSGTTCRYLIIIFQQITDFCKAKIKQEMLIFLVMWFLLVLHQLEIVKHQQLHQLSIWNDANNNSDGIIIG